MAWLAAGTRVFYWFADEHTLHQSVVARMAKNRRTGPDITGRSRETKPAYASRNLVLLVARLLAFQ